jgi:hypothetical protein
MNHHAPIKLLDSGDILGNIWFDDEDLTATSDGVVSDPDITFTGITTNGDEDEDSLTLANPDTDNSLKVFMLKSKGHANDSVNITPANLIGGTKIVFDTLGQGCIMAHHSGYWVIVANNGGVIS